MLVHYAQLTLNFISKNKWLFWMWSFFILIVCTIPASKIPSSSFAFTDKIVHMGLFTIWTILALLIYPGKSLPVILAGLAYGLSLEFYQQLMPFGRTFDWWDELADAVGILFGFFFKTIVIDRYLQRLY